MSDEEEYSEEEEEEEKRDTHQKKPLPGEPVQKTEAELLMEEKMRKKTEMEDETWKEYIDSWRKQREKEEDDLRRLKEKQGKRKQVREEEERKMLEFKKQQEEIGAKEKEEKRQIELEEKRRRLEEAEKRRQAMLKQGHTAEEVKPNFVIQKRTDGGPVLDKMMTAASARGELAKTKEQLAEDKKLALSIRVKPLEIEGLTVDKLKEKAKELWEAIIKLETEKYDLEERQKRQEYDLKELSERQRQINRNKALKKGLDPEALSGKYPPKLQVASKYERRIDRRTYDDKKHLYNGGHESFIVTLQEKTWHERMNQFDERKTRLPKWLGEQPGKKKGDPDIDEEEEKKKLASPPPPPPPAASHNAVEDDEEEEEEEDEDEEEEEE